MVKFLDWPERYRGTKRGVDDVLGAGEATIEEIYRWAKESPGLDTLPVGTPMTEIEVERIEWLWERRIPLGKVSILDGDPGIGKSSLLYDLAARVTSGTALPDGQPVEQAGALIVSSEDGAADTIKPRFLAAGGDPSRARIIGSDTPFVIPDDLDKLERGIHQIGAALVIIDPIMSFLSDDVNSNKDQDVRRALQPLVDIATRTGAAIVICRHLNKSTGGQSIYRGQGSIGFIGIVRSGLVAGRHPEQDDVMVLAGQKNNLSAPPDSLAYRIKGAVTADGIPTARIEYIGRSEVTAHQITATPEDEGERDRLAEAKEFLRNVLRAGPVHSKQIKAEAKEAEIAWRTIERAKGQLKVQAFKDSETGRWMWTLDGPPEDGDEVFRLQVYGSNVGGLGGDGGLDPSQVTPPSLADMADFPNNHNNNIKNKAYIKEDRQLRQLRQEEFGGVQPTQELTPPTNSANDGGLSPPTCIHGYESGAGCYLCDENHPFRKAERSSK